MIGKAGTATQSKETALVIPVLMASTPPRDHSGVPILTLKVISEELIKDSTLGHTIQDQVCIKISVQEKFVGAKVFSEVVIKHINLEKGLIFPAHYERGNA